VHSQDRPFDLTSPLHEAQSQCFINAVWMELLCKYDMEIEHVKGKDECGCRFFESMETFGYGYFSG
ncbi:hypothetical protein KI387_010590, partial [Taxus chinensis]